MIWVFPLWMACLFQGQCHAVLVFKIYLKYVEPLLCNLIFTTRVAFKKGLVMPAHTIKVKHEPPVKPRLCLMLTLKPEHRRKHQCPSVTGFSGLSSYRRELGRLNNILGVFPGWILPFLSDKRLKLNLEARFLEDAAATLLSDPHGFCHSTLMVWALLLSEFVTHLFSWII